MPSGGSGDPWADRDPDYDDFLADVARIRGESGARARDNVLYDDAEQDPFSDRIPDDASIDGIDDTTTENVEEISLPTSFSVRAGAANIIIQAPEGSLTISVPDAKITVTTTAVGAIVVAGDDDGD